MRFNREENQNLSAVRMLQRDYVSSGSVVIIATTAQPRLGFAPVPLLFRRGGAPAFSAARRFGDKLSAMNSRLAAPNSHIYSGTIVPASTLSVNTL